MHVPLTPSCMEILRRLELCSIDDNNQVNFSHRFFRPTTHMAPCNPNSTCNMSPTIPELFFFFLAMCNVQSITHGAGLCKYLLKYIGKFDLVRRILSHANAHSRSTRIGSKFLHNTKIGTSRYNEERAFKQSRDKHQLQFREVAMMNMFQLMLAIPEVITNLHFVEISTLPFEVRSQNKIKLNKKGKVQRPDQSNNVDEEDDNDDNNSSGNVDMTDPNSDAHLSGIPSKRVRQHVELHLNEAQHMTENQVVIARDHQSSSRKYDMISMFGLRPPELLALFQNPQEYYRLCFIDDNTCHTEEIMKKGLSPNLRNCLWFDCLGRRVYIRLNALEEVHHLATKNINEQGPIDDTLFINEFIIDMIRVYKAHSSTLSEEDCIWKDTLKEFIIKDEKDTLPIPIKTPVNPSNTHEFFVHIVLSLGRYKTEIDVLRNPSPRACFEKAGLIWSCNDMDSRRKYVDQLLLRYVTEEVVYFPSSIRKVDGIIVMANRVFEEIIFHDSFSANDIPFTIAEMLNDAEREQVQWWEDMKESQLTAIYHTLDGIPNLPSRNEVKQATRYSPLAWDPVSSMVQSDQQNITSFKEQRLAVRTNA